MVRGGAVALAALVLTVAAPTLRAEDAPAPSAKRAKDAHAPFAQKPTGHTSAAPKKSTSTARKSTASSPAKKPAAKSKPTTSPKAAPATRRAVRDSASAAAAACRPCEHADDCPKVTCECDRSTGNDVGACDTDETHCCATAREACIAFCAAHDETWTGKFGPAAPVDGGAGSAPAEAAEPSTEGDAAGAATACLHACEEPADCPTVSCQCTRTVVHDVAACDAHAKCCGNERVVCEHYCRTQKDRWTGKLVEKEEAPPDDHDLPDLTVPEAAPDDEAE